MKLSISEIIDVKLLQELQDKINAINPFPSALLDLSGKVLTQTAWQDICLKFHRNHPESKIECRKSDQYIIDHLAEASPGITYTCPHGLVDNAITIVVEGQHLANFFTGQFFLETPDLYFFRKQARHYGYDEESYLEAVRKVPVWTREKLHYYLDFIKAFTESLAVTGLARLREAEASRLAEETLKENELRFRTIIEGTLAGYFFIDKDGFIRDVNDSWVRLHKFNNREEILGHHFAEIRQIGDVEKSVAFVNHILANDPAYLSGETSRTCRDGSTGYHTYSARPVFREGKVIGIEGFILDSTRQRMVEMERDVTRNRLISVFDKMVEGFALHEIICDEKGTPIDYRFLEVNPAFEKLTGKPAVEIIGKTAKEIFPDLEISWIDSYGQVALSGNPATFEMFTGELDKYYRVVAFSNQTGQFATIFDDITDRVLAERELQESEKKYRKLADLLPEGVLIHLNGEIRYANLSASRILGAGEAGDLIGKMVLDFVHPDFRDVVVGRVQKISYSHDKVPIIEEKLVRMNGEFFFSEVSAVPFELAGENAVQVVFNDITERKLAEEKLKTLAHAIDSIKECISMTDTENTIIFINKAFCNTYGYTSDELIGQNISMVRSPSEKSNGLNEILSETLGGGWSGEVMNRKKDGTDFPVHISTAIVSGTENKPLALIGIAVDITERKKNQDELVAAKERAEESDRLKSAFLANISHEIRTPLNSILGFSELIEDMVDDPKQLEYLRIISTGGERLLKIINSVIDIAKIEAGQVDVTPVEFDLNTLLKELFELNKRRNLQVTFVCDIAWKDSIPMYTDKTKLFQILNNLISNALKYTKQGSVRFGYSKNEHEVTFYVRDTGIGIPDAFKTKIFERFQKVEFEDRTDFEGTGLGLAITRELVKLLNGEIWFDSEPGKGTVFFVRLPAEFRIV